MHSPAGEDKVLLKALYESGETQEAAVRESSAPVHPHCLLPRASPALIPDES